MTTLHATKAQAQSIINRRKHVGRTPKPAPHFSVNVSFGVDCDVTIVADNVKGSARAIEAARIFAFGEVESGNVSVEDFTRAFGTRLIDEHGKVAKSAKERMLSSMLNSGGLSIALGSMVFQGTFQGYSVPN